MNVEFNGLTYQYAQVPQILLRSLERPRCRPGANLTASMCCSLVWQTWLPGEWAMRNWHIHTHLMFPLEIRAELKEVGRREWWSLSHVAGEVLRNELTHQGNREMAEAAQVTAVISCRRSSGIPSLVRIMSAVLK